MPEQSYYDPPRLAAWLLKHVLPDGGWQTPLGDFEEYFNAVAARRGRGAARRWYWGQVLNVVPRKLFHSAYWGGIMLANYLKIAFRNLTKRKGFAAINVSGLALGIACCMLILLWVQDERSYDRHHDKADQIYRIGIHAITNGNVFHSVTSPAPMAQGLLAEFPEVTAATRLRRFGFPLVQYQDKRFSEERWFYTDSTVFDVFTIPLVQGNPETALLEPNTVVITRSVAHKYFGDGDPMGQTLRLDGRADYVITGVAEDVPRASHVHYDFLASMATINDSRNENWISNNYHTYFVLREEVSPQAFEAKLPLLTEKYVVPQAEAIFGITADEFLARGGYHAYFIQRLTDIHLHSHLRFEHEPNGHITYVYAFSIIAAAMLLLACVNFINLVTARSTKRAREVGVRKAVGSSRSQLMRQFLSESILMSVLAVALAVLLFELVLPPFNAFTGKDLHLPYLESAVIIPALLVVALFVGMLAGTYPAFVLASFNPVTVLKGRAVGKGSKAWLRNALVVFQFAVSTTLIIGTMVVSGQMQYVQNTPLGFDREQVVVIKKTDDLGAQPFGAFKAALLSNSGVSSVSSSSDLMGQDFGDGLYRAADRPDDENRVIWRMWTDADFAQTYRMELVQGRFFSNEIPDERGHVVLNESAVRLLGLEQPVGAQIVDMNGKAFTVIGVMKDFHAESLHQPIKPFVMHAFRPGGHSRYTSVRIDADHVAGMVALLRDTWHTYSEGQLFEYEFFDDHFAKIYLAEERTGRVYFVFSLVAIFISCLGLLGLAAYTAERRTKEIGIRKVLGASASGIALLLSREFAKWVLLANVIAWPVAYLTANRWLENFAYRTTIGWEVFVLAGVSVLFIALLTVSYQAVKAALANPVEALKYE